MEATELLEHLSNELVSIDGKVFDSDHIPQSAIGEHLMYAGSIELANDIEPELFNRIREHFEVRGIQVHYATKEDTACLFPGMERDTALYQECVKNLRDHDVTPIELIDPNAPTIVASTTSGPEKTGRQS